MTSIDDCQYKTRGLSERHTRMLLKESSIAPLVVSERGYYTARCASDAPDVFKTYQRKSGLVVPMYSPDGQTVGYQLRPDKPRKDGPKYETPGGTSPIVDAHPFLLDEVRDGTGPLLITEGVKTGDAATSRGIPTLSLAGVWMWCVPKVKPYRLKPCFDHVRLEDRPVYVAFDSDCMSKPGVQQALAALVAALEARGARVLVVYLPDAPDGSKQGVDDYFAAGGTVKEFFVLARKYESADLGRIRMSRDEKLRRAVADAERTLWREEWKGRGGFSDRDIYLTLIEKAKCSGEIHPDGIRAEVSWGELQVASKVARKTLDRGLTRLEERGLVYRDTKGRKAYKSGAFVVRAKVDHNGREGQRGGEKVTTELLSYDPCSLPLRAPHDVARARWSSPAYTPRGRGLVSGTYRVRDSKPPEPRERVERLGKIRIAVVDALEVAGGSMMLSEVCAALNRKRVRDVRRRLLPMLVEAGILICHGDAVHLLPDWRERWHEVRRQAGEVEADELAEHRRKIKSQAYRERNKAPRSSPSAASLAAMRRSKEKRAENIAAHEAREAKAKAADAKRRRGAQEFVRTHVRALEGRIRLELLQQVLADAGFPAGWAGPAARSLGCRIEPLAEYGGEVFVLAPLGWNAPPPPPPEPEPEAGEQRLAV